ncbi:PGF-pre-PGF domain-containing protein, partial [Candidatus Woesearchaeota archaeon]|nr:PGF-pre-PGF domain-containing protein [Candidatus Woesearchaeota archaeon]
SSSSKSSRRTHVFSSVVPGSYSMKISSPGIAFTGILFSARVFLGLLSLSVEPVSASDVSVPVEFVYPGSAYVYQYVNVEPSLVLDGQIGSVQVEFSVNKSWIGSNGFDPGSVVLSRLVSGSWVQLPTVRTGELEDSHSYSAVSPGFSLFAVSASRSASVPSGVVNVSSPVPDAVPVPVVEEAFPPAQVDSSVRVPPSRGFFWVFLAVVLAACLLAAGLLFLLRAGGWGKGWRKV